MHRERTGAPRRDSVSRELGRGERHRRVLLARAPAVQARLHRHLSRPLPVIQCILTDAALETFIAESMTALDADTISGAANWRRPSPARPRSHISALAMRAAVR